MTAPAANSYRLEVETPAPWHFPDGKLELRGWCFSPHAPVAPLVRLAVGSTLFARDQVISRPDVVAAFSASHSVTACGFSIKAILRSGIHRAWLQASLDGERWESVREIYLTVPPAALLARIEWPTQPVIDESVRLQGWCVHPELPLSEVWLHYGTRQIRCDYGLARSDVPALFPQAPGAARSGFITPANIPTGYGPLRVRGVTTTGEVFFLTLPVTVDVRVDEENPIPLGLRRRFPDLGPARQPPPTVPSVPTKTARKKILFALYGDFTSNSAFHVASLANALCAAGHECTVAVPANPETVRYHPGARFRAVSFADCLATGANFFSEGAGPDLIHAWTTREPVRIFCQSLRARSSDRLVVHLEDHELRLLEATLGRPLAGLLALPPAALDALVPPTLSHPQRSQAFLDSADAVTVIIGKLQELVPAGKPTHLIWPAADDTAFYPRPIPWEFRRELGWYENHTVLFYHGNVHATNAAEVRELYLAVALLNESGVPATLIRSGRDDYDFLGPLRDRVAPHLISLGRIDHQHHLAPLLALADFFVQPGAADAFNDYRFPSKLPEFFSLGRPVIVPRTNLGEQLRHGEDAWVLERADAPAIAAAIRTLRGDPALVARLSEGARAFAATHFSWQRSAERLLEFYNSLLSPR